MRFSERNPSALRSQLQGWKDRCANYEDEIERLEARVEERDQWLCDFVDGWAGLIGAIVDDYLDRAEKAEAALRTEAAAHALTYGALESERNRNLDFAARVIGLDP